MLAANHRSRINSITERKRVDVLKDPSQRGNDLAITLAPVSISVTNGIATLMWPSVRKQIYWVQHKSSLTNANRYELPER